MEATADEAGFGRREQLLAGLLAPLGPGHPHCHTITIRIRGVLDTISIVILAVSEVNPQSWSCAHQHRHDLSPSTRSPASSGSRALFSNARRSPGGPVPA